MLNTFDIYILNACLTYVTYQCNICYVQFKSLYIYREMIYIYTHVLYVFDICYMYIKWLGGSPASSEDLPGAVYKIFFFRDPEDGVAGQKIGQGMLSGLEKRYEGFHKWGYPNS